MVQDSDLVNSREPEICFYCSNSWVNFLWAQQVKEEGFQTSSYYYPKWTLQSYPQSSAPSRGRSHIPLHLANPPSNKINVCPCPRSFPWTLQYSVTAPAHDSGHGCTPKVPLLLDFKDEQNCKENHIMWPIFHFCNYGLSKTIDTIHAPSFYKRKSTFTVKFQKHITA